MIPIPDGQFIGFFPETIDFLQGLKDNNNKSWFEAHRTVYRNYLLKPMQLLVMELADFMSAIDPGFDTVPLVGHAISRIHRDTRFSKDKSPYRPNMWIAFKRPFADWKGMATYYFEIYADYYHFGLGYYDANRTTMEHFRNTIAEKPSEFRQAIREWQKTKLFKVEGQKYKRPFATNDLPPDIAEWYRWKTFYLVCQRKISATVFSHELADELMLGFGSTAAFYHFLEKLKS